MLELPSNEFEIGIDEAGRGPLAFDVVSAAVIMPLLYSEDDKIIHMIKDSKKLSAKKRKMIAEYIKANAITYGIGVATVEEIDKHNILNATYLAMHRALDEAHKKHKFNHIYVDGDKFKPYLSPNVNESWIPFTCVVNGDNKMINIAAASILAKEHRDELVQNIVEKEPDLDSKYGFISNKGYGTAKHMLGLKKYGASQYHRTSFAPVRNALTMQ